MKVILRIQRGITTKAIEVPERCVRTNYKIPINKEMTAKSIGEVQEYLPDGPTNKALTFTWDKRSTWGNSGYPIMDLVDFS